MIAIDGPSGSGKTTISAELAKRFRCDFLDTGSMYRAYGWFILQSNTDASNINEVAEMLSRFEIEITDKVTVNGTDITDKIRTDTVAVAASKVSANPHVRKHLVKLQREWAKSKDFCVVEGRDMCTDVFPVAKHKFYMTASIEERASRRAKETGEDEVLIAESIRKRDLADTSREFSPLMKTEDAVLIDTTNLSVEEAADFIEENVKNIA